MESSSRRSSDRSLWPGRFSLDTWAVFAALVAALIVRASHIHIPW